MDTKAVEEESTGRVISELLKNEILPARPAFDRDGTDLIAMRRVTDGARFVRVQVKGRTIAAEGTSRVGIPCEYLADDFVVLLYVRWRETGSTAVFLFFKEDIEKWSRSETGVYGISFSSGNIDSRLGRFRFEGDRVARLKRTIEQVDMTESFALALQAGGHIAEPQEIGAHVLYDDDTIQVYVMQDDVGVWKTHAFDKMSCVRSSRQACPGDPVDFKYNATTDTWSSR